MPDIMQTIRERMKHRGITQQEVADALGAHQPLISDYMRGVMRPGLDKLELWLDLLDLDVRPVRNRSRT